MGKTKDLTGQIFGNLTVIKQAESDKAGNSQWLCKCVCGNTKTIRGDHLKTGTSKSCGCLCCVNKKHGEAKTRLYGIYHSMRARCNNVKHKSYKDYGGRSISIYPEWEKDFLAFKEWAYNNGYKDTLSIDRIDVNGNYEPSNCRWITNKEQQRNRTDNRLLTYNNETRCAVEWAELLGIPKNIIYDRLRKGWTVERTLSVSVNNCKEKGEKLGGR